MSGGYIVNGVDLDAGTSGPALSDATPAALGVASAGVSAEASRADHVHARELPDPTGAPDGQVVTTTGGAYGLATPTAQSAITTPSLASATGWTATNNGGTAAINTADGRAELSVPAGGALTSNLPSITRATGIVGDWELRARLVAYTGGGAPRAAIGMGSTADYTGHSIDVWVGESGDVELLTRVPGGLTGRGIAYPSLPRAGTGWVRIRYRDGRITVFVGTGIGTAAPTAWRKTHDFDWTSVAVPELGFVTMYALMFGGSGTPFVSQWDSIRLVALEPT